jgi:predicted  nucleic acid-binding Zn-ribbon protein
MLLRLAEKAALGLSTIVDFERGRRAVSEAALAAVRTALEAAGIEFTNGDQTGVRLSTKLIDLRERIKVLRNQIDEQKKLANSAVLAKLDQIAEEQPNLMGLQNEAMLNQALANFSRLARVLVESGVSVEDDLEERI